MESLVIHAVSWESAEGFCAGLSAFGPKMRELEGGRYEVEIPLGGSDRAIVSVLRALADYVSHRRQGSAWIEVYGRKYTMHPQIAAGRRPG